MIFGLKYIPQHGVYRLHEAFDHFIRAGCDQEAFSAACFPDWFGSVYRGCPKLRELSESLWKSLKLSGQDLGRIRAMWNSLCNVESLCFDTTQTLDFDEPSEAASKAIRNLFDYLYDDCLGVKCCKGSCGDIDAHYAQFRNECATVCPFCGLEAYPDSGCGYRAAYDHYLCRSTYPLLSVCFRNLIPICDSCNKSPQKGGKDLLRFETGLRRRAYYPFGQVGGVTISLSWPVKRTLGNPGKCHLVIAPRMPSEFDQVKTWITVYRIPERAVARIQSHFETWIKAILWHRYPTTPTVAQLRALFHSAASRFVDESVLRSETDALYKHGLYAYLANVASDAELEGIASTATSRVVNTPVAIG